MRECPSCASRGQLVLLALSMMVLLAPGCSPQNAGEEKPRANSRQLKHIDELQKKTATTGASPGTNR